MNKIYWTAAALLTGLTAGAGETAKNGMTGAITECWWIAPACAVIALLAALFCYRLMIRAPKGNPVMEEIAGSVREGAMTYLRQQHSREIRSAVHYSMLFASSPSCSKPRLRIGWSLPDVTFSTIPEISF